MKRLLLVLAVLLVSTSVFAQQQFRTEAKFVCGKPDTPEIDAFAFAPGVYYTSINVTNPNDQGAVLTIRALFPDRVAIGLRADHILTGGGSFHCISQQVPE